MNTEIKNELIGERIGAGAQHVVFAYGKDKVIKFPRLWMRLSATYELKKKRLLLMQEHFKGYVLDTEVLPYQDSYCYIQKRVFNPQMLSLRNIGTYKGGLSELQRLNAELRKEKQISLDFLGFTTYLRLLVGNTQTGNIVVQSASPSGICILDTDFLRTSLFNIEHPREIFFVAVSFCGYWMNTFVLKLLGL